MRYQETGEVHLDFHRTMNGTIAYLRKTHGEAFLDEVLRRTAWDVYRSIYDDLKRGDPEQLVERKDGEIRMTVKRCPAIAYLQERGIEIDPAFCRQTVVVNAALAEGTPFEIDTDVLGGGQCVQTIVRVKK
jgi:hypothetical protein